MDIRMNICLDCDRLVADRCMELRRIRGCRPSHMPWKSRCVRCPLGLWPDGEIDGMQLDDESLAVISAVSTGRCLELGTGSGRGTRAMLSGSGTTSVVTVDQSIVFTLAAQAAFRMDHGVTAMHVRLVDGMYDLPEWLGTFDTVLVDGPMGPQHRGDAVAAAMAMTVPGGSVIVDDALRDMDAISAAVEKAGWKMEIIETRKGMAVLHV